MDKYRKRANFIALFHLAWILWGLVSLPLVVVFESYRIVALIFLGSNVGSWFIWKRCVFNIWENNYRKQYDPSDTFEKSFISHYLKKYFAFQISPKLASVIIYSYMAVVFVLSVR